MEYATLFLNNAFALLGEHAGTTRMYAEVEASLPELEEGRRTPPIEESAAPRDLARTGDLRAIQERAMCLEGLHIGLTLHRQAAPTRHGI